jgi:hypothetical protein
MTETFSTGLNAAQLERLAILSEEMGEAQQVIGKILRHGLDSQHPNGGPTNRELLEIELGHVLFAVKLLKRSNDLNYVEILRCSDDKAESIVEYLHFNRGIAKGMVIK